MCVGSPHQVLEILSHINKRVKGHDTISLPLVDLVSLYADTTNTMVRNFAIVYVEMGYNRCAPPSALAVAVSMVIIAPDSDGAAVHLGTTPVAKSTSPTHAPTPSASNPRSEHTRHCL
jgi:hypothetical protein